MRKEENVQQLNPSGNLSPGTLLHDRYRVEKVIGRGGFGITYLATDTSLDIPVAVKEYVSDLLVQKKRADREAKIAASFYDLEGIVSIRNFFQVGEVAYIVMDYVQGDSVRKRIKDQGSMSGKEVLKKIHPLMESLAKIHRKGIIHRDISSDNIMITPDGKLKLIDFGAARVFASYESNEHTLIFKRGFAPVEQYRSEGKLGPWTDVYSLCATIYFMITGIVPEDAMERWLGDKLVDIKEVYGTGLTDKQCQAIMKGLAVRPEDRYQKMEDLLADLDEKEEESPADKESEARDFWTGMTHMLRQEARSALAKEKSRKKFLALAILALLIVAGGLSLALLRKEPGGGREPGVISGQAVDQETTKAPATQVPKEKTRTEALASQVPLEKTGTKALASQVPMEKTRTEALATASPTPAKTKKPKATKKVKKTAKPKATKTPAPTEEPTPKKTEKPKENKDSYSGNLDDILG
ncbi:MAG: serine/threonine protein kinase [Eubacterium sp.]|nr:serine/threonine protein kinase [Eubacterium sp.]